MPRAIWTGSIAFGLVNAPELYELAKEADVPGRADISKQELVQALKAA